ncbi:unnamed protein product [Trypanosoma congolense IL3000]|uniref:WGS project CAEQ00000000 data, annotated contig 386 n=1 Tax=Trypanosoma congolense (strain IL3000) TaxID=1068625 RepID=F9WFH5_TRYCI|nr:unnamed protein product [Trypanosoma congolense IL3000]
MTEKRKNVPQFCRTCRLATRRRAGKAATLCFGVPLQRAARPDQQAVHTPSTDVLHKVLQGLKKAHESKASQRNFPPTTRTPADITGTPFYYPCVPLGFPKKVSVGRPPHDPHSLEIQMKLQFLPMCAVHVQYVGEAAREWGIRVRTRLGLRNDTL